VDATIITRGRRSLGYGFITFASEAEAKKAAEELNNKSLDGREINVEVARTKVEPKPKKKKASESSSDESEKKSTKKVSRASEPSKTTLFVANLPYATTDEDLNKLFGTYKVVSAHITRMKNGRSKGYGFVEFENEEEQLKAIESVKDVQLEGRAIYLKIALSEPYVSDSSSEEETSKKELKKEAKKEPKKEKEAKKEVKKEEKKEVKKEKEAKKEVKKDEKKDEKKKKRASLKKEAKPAAKAAESKPVETKAENVKI
jgi:RNA recognition motif-containing protein